MCVSGLNNWSGKPVARLRPGPRGSNPLITASLFWKRWAFGEPTPFEAGRPSGRERSTRSASASLERWPSQVYGARPESESTFGCRGFKSTLSRHDVHVRQIRLAAAVRKTATLWGFGGSNPLTYTRVSFAFVESGVKKRLISLLFYARVERSSHAQCTAASSKDRTPPCRGVRCEFESRRSRHLRRCTLGWFGGCSFKALIRGFDSRHRRQFLYSVF
jgi:hypothetical protein